MNSTNSRGRLVAIITGAFSIAIGILYLGLITILDARGPMLPPPPEALGEVGVYGFASFLKGSLLSSLQAFKIF